MTRRNGLLTGGASIAAGAWLLLSGGRLSATAAQDGVREGFEVTRTEAEWRRLLPPDAFRVLRQHGTERAGSSPLDHETHQGLFACAGCDLPLYRSEDKFDSRTGWPSFVRPIDGAVGTSEDRSLFAVRTEVHCRRCGGHLGHVFPDGPAPTGQRYCMNGVALAFHPA